MSFLTLSYADIKFDKKSFIWRAYTIANTLSIARKLQLIDKYKFFKVPLGKNSETFVIHVVVLEVS